jgi:Leucine-rich repeat (LRR) protein
MLFATKDSLKTKMLHLLFIRLKILDFSENQIHTINEASFDELENLEELYLNDNKLAKIEIGLYKHLKKLKLLNISELIKIY